MSDLLVRDVRIVPLSAAPGGRPEPVDVLVRGGLVSRVGADLAADGAPVVDGQGRWAVPGLWDTHVHLGQWAQGRLRIDTSAATSAAHLYDIVRRGLASVPDDGSVVQGFGHRSATWPEPPSRTGLDELAGGRPVVLISGDAHHAWLSSSALAALGATSGSGLLEEQPWFDVFAGLDAALPLSGVQDAVASAVREAQAKGVVGIVDMEHASTSRAWPPRVAAGLDSLRVRTAAYESELDSVVERGLTTGAPVAGLVTMGPLKLITDGSLNTRTAHCCTPYADSPGTGTQNIPADELRGYLARAVAHGLDVAVHAIGDAAVAIALDAFEATGARGSIEHAQLVREEDIARMARLGVVASVQPAHLLDDRDLTDRIWPDRAGRCFAWRSMLDAGVTLAFGSDAPIAPLDPWLAVAAAVHRSGDERESWHPEQETTAAEALAASVDGCRIASGQPGDLALLDADPLAESDPRAAAHALRTMGVSATVVAGRLVHGG